ncbi:TPA: restriction endonuclease subunit S [Candidatus Woesearchaeota archaeon]|nr:restriction endonuclease subunit S [Candidatus Woesearchaeota archaeon]
MKSETKFKETEIGQIPEDWEADALGNHTKIIKGISYRSEDYCSEDEGFIFINLKCVARNGGFREDGIKYYKGELKEEQFVNAGDIIIANTDLTQNREIIGSPLKIPKLKTDRRMCISLDLSKLDVTSKKLDGNFLYYYLMSPRARNFMIANGNGTTVVHLSTKNVPNMIIPIPSIEEQKEIAKMLLNLDKKIEINTNLNTYLEKSAELLFKQWFIDCEFPNEKGKPYKSSGGEMVDSELGEIPKGWEVKSLDKISTNYDSKRVPISSREREKIKGEYPYYGATSIMDYINDFIFDGIYLLMAEDGSVITESGNPILQYVWGKCWVNNHTHVLQGKNISTELLYLLLKNISVKHIVTGAVQPKINQKNMNSLKFILPPKNILNIFENHIQQIFSKHRILKENNAQVFSTRNLLINSLMSGQVRVK